MHTTTPLRTGTCAFDLFDQPPGWAMSVPSIGAAAGLAVPCCTAQRVLR